MISYVLLHHLQEIELSAGRVYDSFVNSSTDSMIPIDLIQCDTCL